MKELKTLRNWRDDCIARASFGIEQIAKAYAYANAIVLFRNSTIEDARAYLHCRDMLAAEQAKVKP